MSIDERFILLRKTVRANSKYVIDTILRNHRAEICVFCGNSNDLTKEHVLPRWTFDKCPKKSFITTINELSQEYNKATVPACSDCNSYILGHLEKYIKSRLHDIDLEVEFFSLEDLDNILRWLETIDYKFQVLNLRRTFKKLKGSEFIPYLANIPIGIMQDYDSLTPSQVFSRVRNALKRISTKSRENKRNSLLIFKTTNKGFYFFHKMHDFIFIELPKFKVAIFYFLEKEFVIQDQAYKEAMAIIKKVY